MSRLQRLARKLVEQAAARRIVIATAESCTGGMVAMAITDVPGSSNVFDRAFVTYSNEAKAAMLGVRMDTIARVGAVSQEVAREMAEGALKNSGAGLAVSVTGVAGPDGGTERKPVGLVWFALAARGGAVRSERRLFSGGDRSYVRMRATETALLLALRAI